MIDLRTRKLRQEGLDGSGSHEFPVLNPHHQCHPHRFGYTARGRDGSFLWHQVARIDTASGESQVYDFGDGVLCCEPIFAAKPGFAYEPGGEEPGWLFTECLDSAKGRSFLAVLRADRLGDGPVAKVHLRHPVPLSLHGWWQPT